jgi:hypothetical protein
VTAYGDMTEPRRPQGPAFLLPRTGLPPVLSYSLAGARRHAYDQQAMNDASAGRDLWGQRATAIPVNSTAAGTARPGAVLAVLLGAVGATALVRMAEWAWRSSRPYTRQVSERILDQVFPDGLSSTPGAPDARTGAE